MQFIRNAYRLLNHIKSYMMVIETPEETSHHDMWIPKIYGYKYVLNTKVWHSLYRQDKIAMHKVTYFIKPNAM